MTDTATTDTPKPRKRGRPAKEKAAPVVDLARIEAEILPRRTEATEQLALLNSVPLDTPERRDLFGALLVEIRQAKDALEAQRTSITGPINAAKKAVDALFKPMRDLLDAQDATIVKRLGQALTETRALQADALAAVAAGSRAPDVLAQAHDTAAAPEGLSEITEYDLEVTSAEAIPRPFLVLDESLVLAYVKHKVKAGQAVPEIPGIRITSRVALRRLPGVK
jgi:hypothetical protein